MHNFATVTPTDHKCPIKHFNGKNALWLVLIPSNIAINRKAEQNQESDRSRNRTRTKKERQNKQKQSSNRNTYKSKDKKQHSD